jgi:hypothetical protein
MNFNDCINNYRIEAVKIVFQMVNTKSTLELRLIVQFKATFNRAFKKNTGKTQKNLSKVTSTLTILKINILVSLKS